MREGKLVVENSRLLLEKSFESRLAFAPGVELDEQYLLTTVDHIDAKTN